MPGRQGDVEDSRKSPPDALRKRGSAEKLPFRFFCQEAQSPVQFVAGHTLEHSIVTADKVDLQVKGPELAIMQFRIVAPPVPMLTLLEFPNSVQRSRKFPLANSTARALPRKTHSVAFP